MKAAKKLLVAAAFLAGVATLGAANAGPPGQIEVLVGKNCKVIVKQQSLLHPLEIQRMGTDGMIAFCPEIGP